MLTKTKKFDITNICNVNITNIVCNVNVCNINISYLELYSVDWLFIYFNSSYPNLVPPQSNTSICFEEYIDRRRNLPFFANARSIRNALDRIRLRQANRLFEKKDDLLTREDLMTIEAADIKASRVFKGEIEGHDFDDSGKKWLFK